MLKARSRSRLLDGADGGSRQMQRDITPQTISATVSTSGLRLRAWLSALPPRQFRRRLGHYRWSSDGLMLIDYFFSIAAYTVVMTVARRFISGSPAAEMPAKYLGHLLHDAADA